MGKKLSEMTLEELWELFPIILTEHRPVWRAWYEQEAAAVRALLPKAERISHIGSTAIPSIWAKPIVDILVEMPLDADLPACKEVLSRGGYICMNRQPDRLSFNKGYTENGFAEKVFHLHLRYTGDNDELYFRDYLIEHPDIAGEYEQLKRSLWKEFEHDRDGYTNAKADFVRLHTQQAKAAYKNRY